MTLSTQAKGDNRPHRDQCITDEKDRGGVAGHFQPLDGRGITDEDAAHTHGDTEIVEQVGHGNETRSHQRNAAQAAHQPNRHAHRNLRSESVDDGVKVRRADIGESEPLPARQETWGMELDAGHERQNGARQQPGETAQEKEKHRYAA